MLLPSINLAGSRIQEPTTGQLWVGKGEPGGFQISCKEVLHNGVPLFSIFASPFVLQNVLAIMTARLASHCMLTCHATPSHPHSLLACFCWQRYPCKLPGCASGRIAESPSVSVVSWMQGYRSILLVETGGRVALPALCKCFLNSELLPLMHLALVPLAARLT